MKALLIVLLVVAAVSAKPVCHNITGTCMPHGFLCISGEVVPHEQRCNGVEDCSDGTDEFMCEHADHRPIWERSEEERRDLEQASCVNCNCAVNALTIASGAAWFQYAILMPTDTSLMTGSPGNSAGRPCNPTCTTSVTIGFYKKNRICRGWLCCARQRRCDVCSGSGCAFSSTNRCYN